MLFEIFTETITNQTLFVLVKVSKNMHMSDKLLKPYLVFTANYL